MTDFPCPCGHPLSYDHCCGRFHSRQALPETAEQLMRSRYSAFALERADYLLATLHPARHGHNERAALEKSFENTRWEGLHIVATSAGGANDTEGTVEFIARFRQGVQSGQLHERSRFIRQDAQWLYTDGDSLINGDSLPAPAPGRNDPCWCGSGKKFKKCHG